MNYILVTLALLCSLATSAQIQEIFEIQNIAPKSAKKNRIKSITAWEYNVQGKIPVGKPAKQSFKTFDTKGRLLSKEYLFGFSDIGKIKKVVTYEDNHLSRIEQFFDDTLEVVEIYLYDSLGNLSSWNVDFTEGEDEFDFSKNYRRNEKGDPVFIEYLQKKSQRKDSVCNSYDDQGRLTSQVIYNDTVPKPDSTIFVYDQPDTLSYNIFYRRGILNYTESVFMKGEEKIHRMVEYEDHGVNAIRYHKYDKNGNLYQNRAMNYHVQLNFNKVYHYDDNGIPREKVVYKVRDNPESIVKYEVEYY